MNVFENWCALHDVQPLPAAPADVARFISDCAPMGMAKLWPIVGEISRAHFLRGLADPTLGGAVSGAINAVAQVKPPRSWPDKFKLRFLSLPYDLQVYMAEHEAARDKEIRRAHSERDRARQAIQQPKAKNHGNQSHAAA